ncbi:UNVERIFIED_CONTAM: hypothetical protein GTU68_046335 [Idotea baltica]|nr:hypothetical protein [Idotea baltica]
MTGNSTDALDIVKATMPDVVLLDLRMQELSGIEVLVLLRKAIPDQCVVILTTSVEEQDLMEALRLGAMGYLLKDMEIDVLVQLLHQAKAGDTVVAPDLTSLLARAAVSKDVAPSPGSGRAYNLTPREMDILRHIAQGQSNKDIAAALGIVDGTVKLHVRAVLKKLNVQSRVQAAVLAISENLCDNEQSPK